jgi:hypothetical protein
MFLSTRNYHYNYRFIVKSSKKNCEDKVNKKLDLLIFRSRKKLSFKFLFFFLYILLSGKIFKKNRARITYDNIEIGRFVLAETFRNYECYLNKFKFYKTLIKNFLKAGALINSCKLLNDEYKIRGVYVDHCGYLNGIIFSFFAIKKKIVYSNNYPHGIFCVDYKKSNKKELLKYENALRINIKKSINSKQKYNSEIKISKLVKEATFIPYMIKVNYKKLQKLDYKLFDYVIYCHSFTDGQLWHGYSGFENTLEWLEFTLKSLIKTNKKVLIKPHPNFYNRSMNEEAIFDKKIYDIVLNKYKKYKNLFFIKTPIHNYLLLKKLSKDCVLLSGFGTAILESAYMNFKSICTSHNFFNKKFKISNMWEDEKSYLELLNTNPLELERPRKSDLLKLAYCMFFYYSSTYHKDFYDNIIRKNLKLTTEEYEKKFATKGRGSISKSKLRLFENKTKLIEEKIINEISDTIFDVKE